ncbi:MAG: hypothetical protein J6X70_08660 [Muribaculaceae bacterium]|nr:hypothetical protein [Muribaculaceae bacterium]
MWIFGVLEKAVKTLDKSRGRKRTAPKSLASRGERVVAAVLKKHGIKYKTQYKLGEFVHVDFAVYHKGKLFLVEYDGAQHYHPVKRFGGKRAFIFQRVHDIIENRECKDRKIPLLRIRYDVPYDKIESMLLNFLNK